MVPRRPTGRVVSRHGGLISNIYPHIGLGPELNPDPFFNDPGVWTFGDGWTIAQNTAKVDGSQTGTSHIQILDLLEFNTLYQMMITFPAISAGRMRQAAGAGSGVYQLVPVVRLTELLNTEDSSLSLRCTGDIDGIGDCTFFSCRKVLTQVGPELNPDPFFGNPGLWTFGDGWSIENNTAKISGVQVADSHLRIENLLEPNTLYQLVVTFSVLTAGQMRQGIGGHLGEWQATAVTNLTEFLTSGGDPETELRISGNVNAVGECTFLSVKKVRLP